MLKNLIIKLKAALIPARKNLDKKIDELVIEAEKLAVKADDKMESLKGEAAEAVQEAVQEAVTEAIGSVKKKAAGRPKGTTKKASADKKATPKKN